VDELPGLIKQLEKEAEVSLSNAEKILGLKEGKPVEEAVAQEEPEDEDGIGV